MGEVARTTFLDEACAGGDGMRSELAALLAASGELDRLPEHPLGAIDGTDGSSLCLRESGRCNQHPPLPVKITKTTGPWAAAGETECQMLGARYPFWRLMSSIENQELMKDHKAFPTQRVWLNPFSGKMTALPVSVNLAYSPTAGTGATVIMGSGIGGGCKLAFQPSAGPPHFLNGLESMALQRIAVEPNPQ